MNVTNGGVAKLVIALACHAGDRGFEPRRSRTNLPSFLVGFFLVILILLNDQKNPLMKSLLKTEPVAELVEAAESGWCAKPNQRSIDKHFS